MENKPGVIPLRPLGLGELLDGAIAIVRSYPKVTLGLSAIVVTITQLLQLAASASVLNSLQDLNSTSLSGTTDPATVLRSFGKFAGLSIGANLLSALALLVLTGMITVVVGRAVVGQPISMSQAWQGVRPHIGRLVGASLLTGVIIVAVFLACLLPLLLAAVASAPTGATVLLGVLGVIVGLCLMAYLYVALALATPALVLEHQRVIASLRRSRSLVRGTWWRVCGILLLAAVVATFLTGILQVPFQLLGGFSTLRFSGSGGTVHASFAALAIGALGASIAGTIAQPFNAGVRALLYVDQRIRREGLDVALAQAAQTAQTAQATSAGSPGGPSTR